MRSSRDIFVRIVLLALAVRIVLWAIGAASIAGSGAGPGLHMWSHWDAPNLLRVAENGYPKAGESALYIVYLPLYPFIVRIVAFVARNFILSGLLVSFGASVGAAWFLYRLVGVDADDDEAWRAVLWLFAFPTSYFLSAPYSESLFLFGALAAVYAARKGRWKRVAVAGSLATATRLQALPLLPSLVFEAVTRGRRWPERVRAAAWVGIAGAGFAVYLGLNWWVHRDPFHFMSVQSSHWFNRAAAPWTPLMDAFRALGEDDLSEARIFIYVGRLAATALVVAVLGAGVRRLPVSDQIYGWLALLAILASSWLISMPRYILGIYPIFIVIAWLTRSRRILWPALALSSVAQGFFFWRYASGPWTF